MNTTLLREGTGIGLDRRIEIVDDAHALYVDRLPVKGLQQYGFQSETGFDQSLLDFQARITPEFFADIQPHDHLFASFLNLHDRLTFLRGVASAIVLSAAEVNVCSELLGVQPALLKPAETYKARPQPVGAFATTREHNLQLFRQMSEVISA